MTIVSDILRSKPDAAVHWIDAQASALEAAERMAQKNIGGLIVMAEGRIVGIVTERDYVRKLVRDGRPPERTTVREIMSSPVMYVRPGHTSGECMALMTDNRLRHLPVVDGDQLVGLVSIGDLVKDIIDDQQFTIEQLEHYISGQPPAHV